MISVLLGLDRRDDVAHPVTARRVDRREQRCIPSPSRAAGAAEDLVGEIDAPAARGCGTGGGGACSPGSRRWRRRTRAPPAPANRATAVRNSFSLSKMPIRPMYGAFARNAVQPTETQPVVRHVQPPHLLGQRAHLDIPLHECPAVLEVDGAPQRRACTSPSLARVRRRAACRARPRSSARTAIRLRTLELSHAPICREFWLRPAIVRHDPGLAAYFGFLPSFTSAGYSS